MGFLGSGTAETLFGSRAGDVLTRSTTVIATVFMLTSLSLAYISLKKTGSVVKGARPKSGTVTMPSQAIPTGGDIITKKGSELVEKAKEKLLEKIPVFGTKKEVAPRPIETTKSKIRYDEKGNKIVEEYKYDSTGKLTGHREITYDRFDKIIGEKDLPLVEEEPIVESPTS